MTKPSIQIDGADELRKALKTMLRGIDGLKAVHKDIGELVGEEAARLVPVRTGRLRATIRASGQQAGAVVRAGGFGVPYAAPIHFGWPRHHIEPQPFLYAAADARRDEVIEMYEQRVSTLIKRHGLG